MFGKFYSRKQAGVIYRNVKQGKLEMSKGAISFMYDHADVERYHDSSVISTMCEAIADAVQAVFDDDMELAQACLNELAAAC